MADLRKYQSASGFTIDDEVAFIYSGADPRVLGEVAPMGSILLRKGVAIGELYYKYGLLAAEWTLVNDTNQQNPTPIAPGAVFDFHCYSTSKDAKDKWLQFSEKETTDEIPIVLPWDCSLVAMTYSNEQDKTYTDIELYSVLEADNNGNTSLSYTWPIRNQRSGRVSITPINFSAGTRLGLFMKEVDDDEHPKKPSVVLYFAVTNSNVGDGYSNIDGDLER